MRTILVKLSQLLFVLWAVATVLFFIFRLMPGDPLTAFIEPTFTQAERDLLRQQFGLDQPLFQQYLLYLVNLLHLNLGKSFFYREDVWKLVWDVFPNTIVLTLVALVCAYAVGIVLGAALAWKRNSLIEKLTLPLVLMLRAAPEFWLGMVLLAVFSFSLGWFPSGGTLEAGTERGGFLSHMLSRDFLAHLFLPAMTLALYLVGLPVLLMRSTMLDVLNEDFVTLARMQGFSETTIMLRHAARNALLPVATAFTLGIGYSVGGNVVIETVFSWPGLGRLLVRAVQAHDYPLAQGAFLLIAVVTVTMNGLAELLYRLLDPRVGHVG
ncbi:ABC transporter permease subunit [Mesorhizobium sp. INR15]|nr:ABC transporter permease subunit [Mesorhizobium sp. INR15]